MPVFFACSQKKFFKQLLFSFVLVAIVMAFYGFFVEPGRIEVNHVVIADDPLFQAIGHTVIAHISDLHIGAPGRLERNLLAKLQQIKPDLILITGDMTQWGKSPSGVLEFFQQLEAPLGVFCVLGDADVSAGRKQCIICHPQGNPHLVRKFPIILKNSFTEIKMTDQGGKIIIAGIMPQESDAQAAVDLMSKLPTGDTPVLFLSHFSLPWKKVKTKRPLLWFSGDNHGGQVVMPDFIWRNFSRKSDKEHKAGLFRDGAHKWLYVNRGIGVTRSFPFRIGVPPEITLIKVKQQ